MGAQTSQCCCVACISTGEMGIIERMGKFERIADPGMNCFCYPFTQMTGRVSTRVQQLNVTTETKTKDNVSITLQIAVQYRIINEVIIDDGANDIESVQNVRQFFCSPCR